MVAGSVGASSSSISIGADVGCRFFHDAASFMTVLSLKSITESVPVNSREKMREVANDASSYSTPSSAMNTS